MCRKGLFREEGKPSSLFFLRRRRAEARAGRKVGRKRAGPLRVLRPECAPFSGDTRSAEETGGKNGRKNPSEKRRAAAPTRARCRIIRRRPAREAAAGSLRAGRKTARPEPAGEAHAGAQAGVYAGLKPEFLNLELKPGLKPDSCRTRAGVSGGASVFFRAVFLPDRHGRQSFSGSRAGEKGRFRLLSGLRNEVLCLRKGTPVCFFAFPTGDVA